MILAFKNTLLLSVRALLQVLHLEVRRPKVPQQLLEALVAVGHALGVRLEGALLELLAAVGADEALGVELVAHGRDDAAADPLAAHVAFVPGKNILSFIGHLCFLLVLQQRL